MMLRMDKKNFDLTNEQKVNTAMTVIELILLLRKVDNKGKDVECINPTGVITEIEELENKVVLK